MDGSDTSIFGASLRSVAGLAAALGLLAAVAAAATPEATSLLGQPLAAPELPRDFREKQEGLLAAARAELAARPESLEAAVWVGRRLGYLGRYREAIAVYGEALARHPDSPHLLRHRGHRWLTVRQLDRAAADLERAAALVAGTPDEVEPDGLPNERGIPTSTLQSNVFYHLGLARYLQGDFERALAAYRDGLAVSTNPDMLSATTYWLYLTLRRLGRDDEARAALAPITPELDVIENHDYHRLLLAWKEGEPPETLWAAAGADPAAVRWPTVAYGIGAHHLVAGRRDAARTWFERARESPTWAAFGYLAAEAELARDTATGDGAAELERRIDAYVAPYVAAGHLSATVLVARGGEVLYEKSFGLADHELDVANTPRTRFAVGSIHKPMTSVVLARLVEGGKLALDDRLARFVPDFPRGGEITVRHLQRHESGIPTRVTEPLDETRPQTPATMTALAAARPLLFDPGTDSVYSSPGFSVLARVLELAAGKPYRELLAEHVLRPAGMAETVDPAPRSLLERRARSYVFDTGGLLHAPLVDLSHLVGAGSVHSTPRDLLKMQDALLAGRLGERARELLVRDAGDLAWTGRAHGYYAFADHHAATGIGVAVAANLHSGALERLRAALPEIAAGRDVPGPPPPRAAAAAVDRELLRRYQGVYRLRPGRTIELRIEDGRVRMEEWLLLPVSPTTLFSPQDYAEVEVVLDDAGAPVRLDWTSSGETYALPWVGPLPAE